MSESEQKSGELISPGLKKLILKHVRFVRGKGELTVMAIFYFFVILIPAYYTVNSKVPPENELFRAEGELFFKTIPGKGYLTGLKTNAGEMLFTCKDPLGSDNDCNLGNGVPKRIEGARANILWYQQQTYLWSYQKRLVQLEADGKMILSLEKTVDSCDFVRKLAIAISIFGVFMFIGMNAISRWIFRKIPKEDNNGY